MRFSPLLICLLSAPSFVDAQSSSGLALAGYGYSIPQAALIAAPGELVVVSVYGIGTVPNPLFGGTPQMQLGGISVTLTQAAGQNSVPVPLFGVQQTPCPGHTTGCLPSTSLTVQIPFELGDISTAGVLPSLAVVKDGVATGQVPILPVTDSLHILNSCDNTLIYYSLSGEVAQGQCAPMILHAHGPLVSANSPAVPGETLIMNVYGMGMINNAFWSYCNCITTRPVQPFTLTYDFRPNTLGTRSNTGEPADIDAYVSDGLYQVNFVVPPLPSGTTVPACGPGVESNFTVSLNGPASMDAARLCVQPATSAERTGV